MGIQVLFDVLFLHLRNLKPTNINIDATAQKGAFRESTSVFTSIVPFFYDETQGN